MESFRAALALGIDQLEFDVRVTKDNELVIIHDAAVDRTTNGSGLVCEMTLEQLRQLDAGGWKGEEFCGCKIPTLMELMELVKDHPTITLDVELKEYPVDGRDVTAYSVCDRVLKIIDDYGFTDRVVINSWNATLNEYVHKKYGAKYRQHVYFPQHLMGTCAIDPYSYGYCCCMFGTADRPYMAKKSEMGKVAARGVQPWAGAGVNCEERVDEAIESGVCLITCNNPDEILSLLRRKGYHK
jgi:glycerophosphoryl diester phosphodiesterase